MRRPRQGRARSEVQNRLRVPQRASVSRNCLPLSLCFSNLSVTCCRGTASASRQCSSILPDSCADTDQQGDTHTHTHTHSQGHRCNSSRKRRRGLASKGGQWMTGVRSCRRANRVRPLAGDPRSAPAGSSSFQSRMLSLPLLPAVAGDVTMQLDVLGGVLEFRRRKNVRVCSPCPGNRRPRPRALVVVEGDREEGEGLLLRETLSPPSRIQRVHGQAGPGRVSRPSRSPVFSCRWLKTNSDRDH